MKAALLSINVSTNKGTVKHPVSRVLVTNQGLQGDAHAGDWHRQVSLLAREEVEAFETRARRPIAPGEFGENLTTVGLDLDRLGLLDRLHIGEVELEITQVGKVCHGSGCAIFSVAGDCIMPRKGLFARVVRTGQLHAGQEAVPLPRPLRIAVVTLSDRASAGQYEDRSGPRIAQLLEQHFEKTRWHLEVTRHLIPDDASTLEALLLQCRDSGFDAVLSTGGTGLGPRDLTPEVVLRLSERHIPGIMEAIRVKYGAVHPSALLSRSVAVTMGRTAVYTLPGSVKAASEYMEEILKTLEHLIQMIHGIGH
ncbi:MAG: molybdopterin-binding protein [Myxococcota bacterium]|jgi:molybdenum cofactor synthesis domain-containing protein|nr:molybdopterin-binding protein [Myxococcota bacterium]